MNNRERGWPSDCCKCDLYDQGKQDCGVRSPADGRGRTDGDGEDGGDEP